MKRTLKPQRAAPLSAEDRLKRRRSPRAITTPEPRAAKMEFIDEGNVTRRITVSAGMSNVHAASIYDVGLDLSRDEYEGPGDTNVFLDFTFHLFRVRTESGEDCMQERKQQLELNDAELEPLIMVLQRAQELGRARGFLP